MAARAERPPPTAFVMALSAAFFKAVVALGAFSLMASLIAFLPLRTRGLVASIASSKIFPPTFLIF